MEKIRVLDAAESAFFLRELEHVKARSYDVKNKVLKARTLLPVSGEAGPGAETITYEQYEDVGIAKIIASFADDLPRVDVKGKEFTGRVRSIGDAYGYTVQEVRASRMANKGLEQRRANAARLAALRLENKIAWFGDADNQLQGLLNHPNVPEVTIAADGTGSSATFAAKTATQILRDLNKIANAPIAATQGTDAPDTLLLPIDQYTLIASTPVGTASDTTILEYFLQNNPFIRTVDWLPELKGAYSGPLDGMFVYKRDPDYVTLEVPQDFEQFPVQERNLELIVPCHQRCGGVRVYYPLVFAFAKGI